MAGIVVSVLAAKLLKEIRQLIARAEQLADSAAQLGELFKDASGPLALIKLIRNIINHFTKSSGGITMTETKSKNGSKFAIGAILAAVAGFLAGLLTAPKSG